MLVFLISFCQGWWFGLSIHWLMSMNRDWIDTLSVLFYWALFFICSKILVSFTFSLIWLLKMIFLLCQQLMKWSTKKFSSLSILQINFFLKLNFFSNNLKLTRSKNKKTLKYFNWIYWNSKPFLFRSKHRGETRYIGKLHRKSFFCIKPIFAYMCHFVSIAR